MRGKYRKDKENCKTRELRRCGNEATTSLEDGGSGGRGTASFVRGQKMERKEDSQLQWQEIMKALM